MGHIGEWRYFNPADRSTYPKVYSPIEVRDANGSTEVTEYFQFADREAGELLLACANLTADEQTVTDEINRLVDSMKSSREHHIKEIKEFRKWWAVGWLGDPRNEDDLGLPQTRTSMPSDSETLDGQQ
jgi:hypothetical protein